MSIWRKDTKRNTKRRRGAASRASQVCCAQPHRTGRRRLQCEALESRIVLSGSGTGGLVTFDDSVISTTEGGGISFDLEGVLVEASHISGFASDSVDLRGLGQSGHLQDTSADVLLNVIPSSANQVLQQISLSPLASTQEGGEIGFGEYQNSGTGLAPFGDGSLAENGAPRASQEEGLFLLTNPSVESGISGALGRANLLEVASHSGEQSSSLRSASAPSSLSGPFGARSDFSQRAEGAESATVSKQTFHAQFAADNSRLTGKATAESTGAYARGAQQPVASPAAVNTAAGITILSETSTLGVATSNSVQANEVVFSQVGERPFAEQGTASRQNATTSDLNAETHTAATGAVFAHWEDEPTGVVAAARGLTENKTQEGENWSFVVVLVAAHLAVDRFAHHGDETKQRPPE